jgi:hypothetical protein
MLVGSLTAELMESEGTDFGNPDIVKYVGKPRGRGPVWTTKWTWNGVNGKLLGGVGGRAGEGSVGINWMILHEHPTPGCK